MNHLRFHIRKYALIIYPYQEIVNPFSFKKFLNMEIFFLILYARCDSVNIEVINVWLDKFNEMRKNSGMSLDEISAKSGVPKGTLSKITAGITKAPPLETMRKLVHSMGYTLDDLDDNPQVKKNASLYSSEAEKLAQDYDSLDEFGKKAVRAVTDVEKDRCAAPVSFGNRPMIQAAARSGGVTEIESINPDEISDGEAIP